MTCQYTYLGYALAPQYMHLTDNDWHAPNRQQCLGNTPARHFGGARPQSSSDDGGMHVRHIRSKAVGHNALDRMTNSIGRVALWPPAQRLQPRNIIAKARHVTRPTPLTTGENDARVRITSGS